MLIPVGIVGFGYGLWTGHDSHINELCRAVGDERSCKVIIDVLGGGNWTGHSGRSLLGALGGGSQIAVLQQPEVVDNVDMCLSHLMAKLLELGRAHEENPDLPLMTGVVVAVGCWSGQPRADVLRRVLAEMLNSVKFDGQRVFNACDFSLNGCESFAEKLVKLVEQWINKPWKEQKTVSMYGSWSQSVIGKDWAARQHLREIWRIAASFQKDHEENLIKVFKVFDPDRLRRRNRSRNAKTKTKSKSTHQVKKEQTPASSSKAKKSKKASRHEQEEQLRKKSRGSKQ